MKKIFVVYILLFFAFALFSCASKTITSSTLVTTTISTTAIPTTEEPFLPIEIFGQPGLIPEIFAPGFISTDENTEFAGTFSPDYLQYFYTRRTESGTNRLFYTTFIQDAWTDPVLSPISEDVTESEPFITNDGTTLYFQSRRDNPNQYAIYQSSFINDSWQTPVYAENGLNEEFVMYITVSNSGNIYYTGTSSTGTIGIYVIEYVEGVYQPSIFTGVYGAHPYIAPDESYMLIDQGVGAFDYIYITLNESGDWTTPVKLGEEVNQSDAIQICPSVTVDGEYFFFSRFLDGKSDIYWVDGAYLTQYMP